MAKPIKPSEVEGVRAANVPDAVFEAFNELIAENFSSGRASFKQKDVVARIVEKFGSEKGVEDEIFKKGWLNVEGAYRKEGWIVEYDKPGYCETYDAFFTFRKR